MASFTGIDADAADAVLGASVVSGTINGAGHLILTRGNGSTIDAGDFTAIVTGILQSTVDASVAAAIPPAVAGKAVDKGTISGAITFTEFTRDTLVNATIICTANGNLSINTSALPASPRAGTQFALRIAQDGTGGRTLTLTGFKKSQGVLTLTTTAGAIDIVVFYWDGTAWYAGMMGVDFK